MKSFIEIRREILSRPLTEFSRVMTSAGVQAAQGAGATHSAPAPTPGCPWCDPDYKPAPGLSESTGICEACVNKFRVGDVSGFQFAVFVADRRGT